MKYPAEVDVAVLILFFTRPEPLRLVFEAIRKARPSRLYLYQDGPRNEGDMAGIEACRQVVSDEMIDWECDVRRNYQTVNAGCDPSNYRAQRWAFSLSDKCVVFEDDSIPSVSFIRFCKEMLDRYEHDERIVMVSGFNTDEVSPDIPDDYFFTTVFSIWGWASWRRVIDRWDGNYSFLDDDYNMHQLRQLTKERRFRDTMLRMCYDHRALGKEYYESIFWTSMMFNHGLAIMPSRNMINNLGAAAGGNSTHYAGSLETLPKRLRKMFTMQRHEMQFPLKHPRYVIENVDYLHRFYRINAYGHPFIKVQYAMEELCNNLRYGNFRYIGQAMKNRIVKLLGHKHYQ
ncbi:MAG: hemolysin activation protein [Prevotella sp.]|nr:hemolysin activation protein [Prevotella sp.]